MKHSLTLRADQPLLAKGVRMERFWTCTCGWETFGFDTAARKAHKGHRAAPAVPAALPYDVAWTEDDGPGTAPVADHLTPHDLDAMTEDDRWLGFGYLGERDRARQTPDRVTQVNDADEIVLAAADHFGWTYEDLFAWANSKNGRWAGDILFGRRGELTELDHVHLDRLLVLPTDA